MVVNRKEVSNRVCSSIRTTLFIQDVIKKYECLFKSIIFIKHLFGIKGWNNAYKGGLCGYGLTLMFLTFIGLKKRQECTFNLYLLREFFTFFVSINFETHCVDLGIGLCNFNSPIRIKNKEEFKGMIIYDPTSNDLFNVSSSCTNFLII